MTTYLLAYEWKSGEKISHTAIKIALIDKGWKDKNKDGKKLPHTTLLGDFETIESAKTSIQSAFHNAKKEYYNEKNSGNTDNGREMSAITDGDNINIHDLLEIYFIIKIDETELRHGGRCA